MGPLYILAVVAVLILLVTLGHGIWVSCAWVLRGGRRRGDLLRLDPTVSDDRAATARCLQRLRFRGLIDADTQGRVLTALGEDVETVAVLDPLQTKASTSTALPPVERARGAGQPATWPGRTSAAAAPGATTPAGASTPTGATSLGGWATAAKAEAPVLAPTGAEAPLPPVSREPVPPPQPRRPLAAIISAFMAEKNIRWGELVGGLLIVGCSTALAVSLWAQIESIPALKFVMFTAVTTALFGAGLFVYHRWRIPTTGHMVLLVATMLVPLNLLAFAAFALQGATANVWTRAIELLAVLLFGGLTYLAGRVVVPDAAKLFAGGVVALSACSLLVRFISPLAAGMLLATALPVGIHVGVMAAVTWRYWPVRRVSEEAARRTFIQLGAQSFACLVPFGLVVYASGHAAEALRHLSPVICGLAGPAFIAGMLLWRRLARTVSPQMHTAAVSIALACAGVMLISLRLAWPAPAQLVPALMINGLVMVAVNRVARHPVGHALAVVWFTAAGVLGVHLLSGSIAWSGEDAGMLIAALLSARTGQVLVAAVVACGVLAMRLHHRGRSVLARGYMLTGMVIGVISLGLVTLYGFGRTGDPHHVIWVYSLYAAVALVTARRTDSPFATWTGSILAQAAISQALVFVWQISQFPWPTSFLAGATVCTVAAAGLSRAGREGSVRRQFVLPLAGFATAAGFVAGVWMVATGLWLAMESLAVRMAWLSALAMVLALVTQWRPVLAGGQIALALAAGAGVQHRLHGMSWYQNHAAPLREPWVWQVHAVVLATQCLIWEVVRTMANAASAGSPSATQAASRVPGKIAVWPEGARHLLEPGFALADRGMFRMAMLALIVLSLFGAAPGVVQEHGAALPLSMVADHLHAAGWGSWLLLILLLGTAGLHGRGRINPALVQVLLVACACGIALVAARFKPQHLVVTSLRCLSAVALLIGSALVWTRSRWVPALTRAGLVVEHPDDSASLARVLLLSLLAVPVLVLTGTFTWAVGQGTAIVPGGITDVGLRVLLLVPIALVAAALLGYGYSERQSSYAALAAVLACAATTHVELTVGLPPRWASSVPFIVRLIQLNVIVLSAVALMWCVLRGWRERSEDLPPFPTVLLLIGRAVLGLLMVAALASLLLFAGSVPALVAAVGNAWGWVAALALEVALLRVVRRPTADQRSQCATVWLLFGTVLACSALERFDTGNWLCFHTAMIGLVAAGALRLWAGSIHTRLLLGPGWQETFDVAAAQGGAIHRPIDHDLSCVGCGYNLRGLPTAGRCPECGTRVEESRQAATSRLAPQWRGTLDRVRQQTTTAVLVGAALTAVFAVRAAYDDPQRPWWSVGALAASGVLGMALAAWMPRRVLAYAGGIQLALAASIWWLVRHWHGGSCSPVADAINLANANLVALGLAGLAWWAVERRCLLRRLPAESTVNWSAFHRAILAVSTAAMATEAGAALVGAVDHVTVAGGIGLTGLAWGVTVALAIACRWDASARQVPIWLYVLGLAAIGHVLARCALPVPTLLGALSVAIAVHAAGATLVGRTWPGNRGAEPPAVTTPDWLTSANGVTTLLSTALAVYVSFVHTALAWRLLTAAAPALCAGAWAFAAAGSRRDALRTASLALISAAAILLAWAGVPPEASAGLLHRAAEVVAVGAVLTVLASAGAAFLNAAGAWVKPITRNVAGLAVAAGGALAFCGVSDVLALAEHRPAPLADWAVWTLILALAVMIVSCVVFATRDRLDPLRLPANAQEYYVYVAEWLAAVLALHVRATMPWLFSGLITQYWPLLVMGLAFAAAGASEVCERRGLHVLGRPLGRTGIFLPALTLVDLFVAASQVHFSVVLLCSAVLYAILAGMHRSKLLAVPAVISLNGSLWYLLQHTPGLGLTEHPQLWFIPPALAVLAAGHLNRRRLTATQLRTLNYGCLFAVYLSSTADIFLIGVAQAPWLPIVLAVLSVGGIFVGIAARIRSFLLFGTGFMGLALLTMIWHAATNLGWTWSWYVAGILLGAGIITVFALFEKKRAELHAWISEFRSWQE